MAATPSILDELRVQYEAARVTHHDHSDVEGYEQINARLRKAYAWLDKAFSYLDGVKPAIEHRFDVGHGLIFEETRFGRGYVGQHERRIVGFPVIDEINIYYEIAAARPLTIEVAPGGVQMAEKALDDAGLQYTCKRVEDHAGTVRKCVIIVPPAIPAKVSFTVNYQTGIVTVPLVNVDRFDRVSLEFHSQSIDEQVLDDLLKFILGRDSSFLRRAPLAGLHGTPRGG
ncbi:MAG: hypothetical protein U1F54_05070 [Burkholderiales bacterium]